ncbi:hypothetical protein AB0D90_03555 [Streptomyces althioticus]|uniref:hypothetical protein n=1 Tax=Streptomyces althioticus TaxID=83380 RepID=UPI0033EDAA13
MQQLTQYAVLVRNGRGRTTELLTAGTGADAARAALEATWRANGTTGMEVVYVRPTGGTVLR